MFDGVEPQVAAGVLVAVLGRSGSGKSTLVHVLGRLDTVDAGRIEVAGERVDGFSERRLAALRGRRIGFAFQFFHLLSRGAERAPGGPACAARTARRR